MTHFMKALAVGIAVFLFCMVIFVFGYKALMILPLWKFAAILSSVIALAVALGFWDDIKRPGDE